MRAVAYTRIEPMLAIETQKLEKKFRSLRAVDGIDLRVNRGEIYGLLGPNGSGKTTLIRLITGILKPTAGKIIVLGRPVPDNAALASIGYMTQALSLYDELSVRENVAFFASMCGVRDRDSIDRVLRLVDLAEREKTRVRVLSGGMQRRASLACALVHEPELLLLDEPTVGVDPSLRAAFWEYFRRAADTGTTLLVSSHVMDEASRCDRLGFIRDGRLIAEGSSADLIKKSGAIDLEDAFLRFVSYEEEST